MKTLLTLLVALAAQATIAQSDAALVLYADANQSGKRHVVRQAAGYADMRIDLQHAVSSLTLAAGYTLTLHDAMDGGGQDSLLITGPCVISDLKVLPRLHGNGNWDNTAVALTLDLNPSPTPAPMVPSGTLASAE